MKGKRKPNGHQEKRGKQSFRRTIKERNQEHPDYANEFGHLEGDTIVGHQHKSAIITLVERLSKCIIEIKTKGMKAQNIEESLIRWFQAITRNLFKTLIFDW